MAIKESSKKQHMIQSNWRKPFEDDEVNIEDGPGGISHLAKYTGSEFYLSVQAYLNKQVDSKISYQEK